MLVITYRKIYLVLLVLLVLSVLPAVATAKINGTIVGESDSTTPTPIFTTSPTPSFADFGITTSAGPGGKISPDGGFAYAGSSYTFTITPDFGYQILDVKVDGVSQGNISTYSFTNIQSNHEISATFTATQTPTSRLTIVAVVGIVVIVIVALVALVILRKRHDLPVPR